MDSPTPRPCKICLQAPCACPDYSDERDDQGAQEDADFFSMLMGVYDAAGVEAVARA